MCQRTLILQPYLWLGGLSPPLFLTISKSVRTLQIYKKYFIIQNFLNYFLDKALTLPYGVDARMCDFADIAEADTLTQKPYFLGILAHALPRLTSCSPPYVRPCRHWLGSSCNHSLHVHGWSYAPSLRPLLKW